MGGSASEIQDLVVAHARQHFPGRRVDLLRWDEGGIVENIVDLGLVRIAGGQPGEPWVYMSAGASAEPMEEGFGVEFFLVTRDDERAALKLLAMIAHLHADPRYPLSLGQVLEIGHPWLPGASCDHILVSLPGPFGDDFEWLSTPARTIRLVWLLPITRDEADFARSQGFGPLQEKLGAAQADPTDPMRMSVLRHPG